MDKAVEGRGYRLSFTPVDSPKFRRKLVALSSIVNSGQLRVAIPAADLVKPATAQVNVSNPVPGGGKSTALTFTIHSALAREDVAQMF